MMNERYKAEHYHQNKIEPFEVIDDWGLDFYLGNVVKYICRAKYKGSELDDIRKAIVYLQYYESKLSKGEIMMYSKEMVLNNCYKELSDVLMDLLKYEFIGIVEDCSIISLVNKMLENTQLMIDNIDDFEWSDVMKVRQTNYSVIRMVNTLLINQYDKIFIHKSK